MKNVLFFTLPFWGHINPNIELFKVLKCHVNLLCVSSEKFQPFFRGLHISAANYPVCVEEYYGNGIIEEKEELAKQYFKSQYEYDTLYKIIDANFSVSEEIYLALMDVMRDFQPNLIIADAAAFWTPLVAMKLNTEYLYIESATNMLDVSQDKYFMDYIEDVVSAEIQCPLDSKEVFHNFQVLEKKQKKHFAKLAGLKLDKYREPLGTIAYLSKELQIGSEEISQDMCYAGFHFDTASMQKDKKIFVTRGTISDFYNLKILKEMMECASEKENYHIVATIGNTVSAGNLFADIACKKNVTAEKVLDQIEELKSSVLMITHGGISGVREAIMCEVPLIIFPTSFHCYQVGLAIEKAKAGILLKKHPLDKEEISTAIDTILGCGEYVDNVRKLKCTLSECSKKHGVWSYIETFLK